MVRFYLVALIVCAAAAPAWAQSAAARILVVPFEVTRAEPHHHWLREASAILLADGLRARGLAAIPRAERVGAFEHLRLPLTASLTRATIIKVGQLVGATEIVVGSLRVEGAELTTRAHTIRLDAGRRQPEAVEQGPLTDLLSIVDRLAGRLSGGAAPGTAAPPAPPLGAFENYVKGLLAESAATRATFLESAIREYPAFDRARLALWDVRTDQADHDAALAAVRAVPAASAVSRRARFAAGISLLELRKYQEAYDEFQALLDEKTTAPQGTAAVLNNLGVVQIRRGVTGGSGTAVYFLTQAADADPDPDYLFNLGYAYVLERNFPAAVYWLREALRRDPGDADAHFVIAVALQATGSSVEAARERELAGHLSGRYESLARPGADKAAAPAGLERVSTDLEGPRLLPAEQAIVTSAQREQSELATFHLERGRRLFESQLDTEAMTELRRAVYLSPYLAPAHLLIGRIHLRGGRPADAIEALKISVWSADTAAARVALAEAYVKLGDAKAARAEAERALALEPESADAKRLLATLPR